MSEAIVCVSAKRESTVCACLTSVFSLFVCNQHVVKHTAMTENKKQQLDVVVRW